MTVGGSVSDKHPIAALFPVSLFPRRRITGCASKIVGVSCGFVILRRINLYGFEIRIYDF
jgi:hypothetical protein